MARSRTKVRDPHAQAAWKRKAGPMTARNAPKGGSHNWREHLPAEEPEPETACGPDCDCQTEYDWEEYQDRELDEEWYMYGSYDGEEPEE